MRIRFRTDTFLWAMLVFAICFGWAVDRRQLHRLKQYKVFSNYWEQKALNSGTKIDRLELQLDDAKQTIEVHEKMISQLQTKLRIDQGAWQHANAIMMYQEKEINRLQAKLEENSIETD